MSKTGAAVAFRGQENLIRAPPLAFGALDLERETGPETDEERDQSRSMSEKKQRSPAGRVIFTRRGRSIEYAVTYLGLV